MTTLGDVCTVRSSLVDPTRPEFAGLPHIAPDSIEKGTGRLLGYRTAGEDRVTSGKYRFEAGDVLYSKIRPNLNKVALVDIAGVCSADMYALDVDRDQVTPEYVAYVLRSRQFLDYATSLSNRANIPKLNREQLLRFNLHAPPLSEQRRIAAILDLADALRAKRRQVLAHLDGLTQSIFQSTFGNPLGEASDSAAKPLREWIDPRRPITYGILKPGTHIESGVPYVRVADMQDRGIRVESVRRTTEAIAAEYRRSTLRSGDLLMSIRGHVGRFAFVPDSLDGANITQDSARLAVYDPQAAPYVRAAMESPSIQHWMARRTKGAAVKGINLGDLRDLPLLTPPPDLLRAFAHQVATLEAQRVLASEAVQPVETLFASLQSRAFRGDL